MKEISLFFKSLYNEKCKVERKIEKYKKNFQEKLTKRSKILNRGYSESYAAKKLNIKPFEILITLKVSTFFAQEFTNVLEGLIGEKVNLSDINYARISSKEEISRAIIGDYKDAFYNRADYLNCIVYKQYAVVLSKKFNNLIYINENEVDVLMTAALDCFVKSPCEGIVQLHIVKKTFCIEIYKKNRYINNRGNEDSYTSDYKFNPTPEEVVEILKKK